MIELTYIVAVALFFAGALINLGLDSSERDKHSPRTPEKFNLLFLLTDNWKRIGLIIVLSFVFPLVAPDSGIEITYTNCLGAGFVHDRILQALKNKFSGLQVTKN